MREGKGNDLEDIVLSLLERISKQWGLGKPCGRIWGFLLFENKPVSQERIEKEVGYSRGLVSIALNKLISLGLVRKYKGDNVMLYEANISVIDGFNILVTYFLKEEIEPLIEQIKKRKDNLKDPVLKRRAENAIEEYEKLRIVFEIFSSKLKKISSLSLSTLKELYDLHDEG